METPPASHREWALYFQQLVPGECRVEAYYDEGDTHSVPIATSRQADGAVAATIGLMDIDQGDGRGDRIPVEVLMDVRGDLPEMQNVLATVAFAIIKDGWRIRPGALFERFVAMYRPDLALPHVYFTTPFQWGERMTRVHLSDRLVFPLLAIPISQVEAELVAREGGRALERRWESASTDVLDWARDGWLPGPERSDPSPRAR